MLVNILCVPIVIRHLGAEGFGIWVTITTTLTMLLVLDLGVANSLTNLIAEANAHGDREHASRYMTTALGLTTGLSVAFALVAWFGWPFIHWDRIFSITNRANVSEVSAAVGVALAIFLLDLPARLAAKVLGGYQELAIANVFSVAGNLGSLAAIAALVYARARLATLVAGTSAPIVAADIVCSLWLVWRHKPWLRPRAAHLSRQAIGRILNQGSSLFILQVSGLLVFDTDNVIIAHYLGPADVAPYSTAWRLASGATFVHSLIFPALWPAFSDAFVRGEIGWIRRTFWRVFGVSMLTAVVYAALLAFIGRWAIRVWATSAAVPGEALLLLMCVWVLISTYMNNTVTVLLAKGDIRLLAWLALMVGLLNIAVSITLVQRIGAVGVILGTIVSYVSVVILPQSVLAWRTLYGNVPRPGVAP